MSQLLSTEQNRIRDELLGLIDRPPQSPQTAVLIGLFGPTGSGKTTLMEGLARPNVTLAARTRNHRRVVGLNIDARAIPSYMLPWQYMLSQVLDRLDEQALPSEIEVIKGLRSRLLLLIKRDPKLTATEEDTATVSFTKQFRQILPNLVASSVTQANNVLLIGVDHLDKVDANTSADLLDATAYFLRVPGVAVMVMADEGALVEKVNQATDSTDGSAQLRSMLQARLELPARAKSAVGNAVAGGLTMPSKPKTVANPVGKAASTTAAATLASAPTMPSASAHMAEAGMAKTASTASTATASTEAIAATEAAPPISTASAPKTETKATASAPKPSISVAATSPIAKPSAAARNKDVNPVAPSGRGSIFSRISLGSSPVLLALLVLAFDRITKILVRYAIPDPPGISVIGNFLRLDQYFATTTANGLFRGSIGLGVELLGLFLAVILMVFAIDRNASVNRRDMVLRGASFGLIVGALAANLLDRLIYGGILNFVHMNLAGVDLPVFNIAHLILMIGELILVYTLLKSGRAQA